MSFVYRVISFAEKGAARILPAPVKHMVSPVYGWVKRPLTDLFKKAEELEFEKEYVKQFRANPAMILEDWKTYHDLDKILDICQIPI